MVLKEPTYEEYKLATAFVKFKYKYSIIIMILCWLCLLFLCYYMFTHGESIARNPLMYGANHYSVECRCYNYDNPITPIEFYVNGSKIWTLNKIP